MQTIMQSEIFFFISSVGFIILFGLIATALFYAVRAFRTWDRILNKFENNVGTMSDTAKDMLEDVRDSSVFRFLTGLKRRKERKK